MPDHQPSRPPHIPSFPRRSSSDFQREEDRQIEAHLSAIEGIQRADHIALTALVEAVGSSPDAATGAEGRGMRKQIAELASNTSKIQQELTDVRKELVTLHERFDGRDERVNGRGVIGGLPPRGSVATSVGAVIGGIMGTCAVVLEMLKMFGLLK